MNEDTLRPLVYDIQSPCAPSSLVIDRSLYDAMRHAYVYLERYRGVAEYLGQADDVDMILRAKDRIRVAMEDWEALDMPR
jgi:hypothetical protein